MQHSDALNLWYVEHELSYVGEPGKWRRTHSHSDCSLEEAIKFALDIWRQCRNMKLKVRIVNVYDREDVIDLDTLSLLTAD